MKYRYAVENVSENSLHLCHAHPYNSRSTLPTQHLARSFDNDSISTNRPPINRNQKKKKNLRFEESAIQVKSTDELEGSRWNAEYRRE